MQLAIINMKSGCFKLEFLFPHYTIGQIEKSAIKRGKAHLINLITLKTLKLMAHPDFHANIFILKLQEIRRRQRGTSGTLAQDTTLFQKEHLLMSSMISFPGPQGNETDVLLVSLVKFTLQSLLQSGLSLTPTASISKRDILHSYIFWSVCDSIIEHLASVHWDPGRRGPWLLTSQQKDNRQQEKIGSYRKIWNGSWFFKIPEQD